MIPYRETTGNSDNFFNRRLPVAFATGATDSVDSGFLFSANFTVVASLAWQRIALVAGDDGVVPGVAFCVRRLSRLPPNETLNLTLAFACLRDLLDDAKAVRRAYPP